MMNLLMLHICFVELHLAIGNILPSHRINVVHKEKIPLSVEKQQQSAPLLNVKGIRNRNTTDASWPAVHWLPKPFLNEESQATNMVYQETINIMEFPTRRSEIKLGSALHKKKTSGKGLLIRKKRSWQDFLWYFDDDDYVSCDYPPCPTWSEYHGKGSCDVSCGGGKRVLIRYCEHAREDQDQGGCQGENTKVESCNTHPCPSWSDWAPKGICSSTCGAGVRTYKRTCMDERKVARGCFGRNTEYRTCNNGVSCPAQWTPWSKFGPCANSCGVDGFQLRKRVCIKDGRKLSGRSTKIHCKGYSTQQKRCLNKIDCKPKYSEWSAWSHCDAMTCDSNGRRTRTRHCIENGKPKYRSKTECNPEDLSQSQACQTLPCVKACEVVQTQFKGLAEGTHQFIDPTSTWSQWSSWSECSVSCGLGGRRSRSRMCFSVHVDDSSGNVIVNEARRCEGKSMEQVACQYNDDCPHWNDWQEWSKCSRGCGVEGRKKRTRLCIVNIYKMFNTTEHEMSHSRKTASGKGHIFSTALNDSSDYLVDTVASYPNTTLLIEGKDTLDEERVLDRKVAVQPSWCKGGKSDAIETASCNDHPCLPRWREWQAWSECSVTCGRGQAQRVRKCSIGNCHGAKVEFKTCYAEPCMTPWSEFSPCTKSCGGGEVSRHRNCIILFDEESQAQNCTGSTSETMACNEEICPVWSEWGSWGDCSGTCTEFYNSENKMSRTRKCLKGNCIGHSVDIESCNNQPCPYWSQCTAFSCCSVSCGDGTKTRTRGCRNGYPGESGCIGNETDVEGCNMNLCNVSAPIQLNPESCGVRPAAKTSNSWLKIFNGKISNDHQWPWQVSWQHLKCVTGNLGCRWEHLCGATLIGPRWVVTAAHCIENIRNFRVKHHEPGDSWSVVVGMSKLYETGTRHFIRRVFPYPDYHRYPVPENDISLLKLRDSVAISTFAVPACLPSGHVTSEEEQCFITGWGNTDPYSTSSSNVLREAKVPFLNFTKCQQISLTYETYLSVDKHMCAGDIESSQISDSCEGDSGGPLVCLKTDGRWYLAGVTSFGFKDCGTPGHPGIYAPVKKYEEWIRNTISVYTYDGC